MPGLVQLRNEYPKDLEVIGWHVGKGSEKEIAKVIKKQKLEYPIVVSDGMDEVKAWGGEHPPMIAIIDRKGRLVATGLKPGEGEERALELLKKTRRSD